MNQNAPVANQVYELLADVKRCVRAAQTRAVLAVNAELLQLYWQIGRLIENRQLQEGYGTSVVPRLARDLQPDLPEVKGFFEQNINRTLAPGFGFARSAVWGPWGTIATTCGNTLGNAPSTEFERARAIDNRYG